MRECGNQGGMLFQDSKSSQGSPGKVTRCTFPLNNTFSADIISSLIVIQITNFQPNKSPVLRFLPAYNLPITFSLLAFYLLLCRLFHHLLSFFDHILDGSGIHKGLLGIFVHFSAENHFKTPDRFFEGDHNSLQSGKLFCHMKRL